MNGTQIYMCDSLRKEDYLTYPAYEPSDQADIIINEPTSISFTEFKNITPITEETWIPLESLYHYAFATRYHKTYFYDKTFGNQRRRYKSLVPYLANYFFNDRYGLTKVITAKGTYFICKGSIMDKDMKPLLRVMVQVAPSTVLDESLKILDSKVLIDYSVYGSSDEAEKLIKNQLIQMFIRHKYRIELCNLKEMDIWEHPIMPKRLEKSRDLVYNVLRDNIRTLNQMVLN